MAMALWWSIVEDVTGWLWRGEELLSADLESWSLKGMFPRGAVVAGKSLPPHTLRRDYPWHRYGDREIDHSSTPLLLPP